VSLNFIVGWKVEWQNGIKREKEAVINPAKVDFMMPDENGTMLIIGHECFRIEENFEDIKKASWKWTYALLKHEASKGKKNE